MRVAERALAIIALGVTGCSVDGTRVLPTGPSASMNTNTSDYIVVLRPGTSPDAVAQAHGVQPRHVYRAALHGFAAALPVSAVEALERNPVVGYVEHDATITLSPTGTGQTFRIWGLDRINQREIATAGDLNLTMPNDGASVHTYIIDTGIRSTHAEFGGRVVYEHNAVTNQPDTFGDCNGHGTHVAGTVGGATYGVAKQVKLVSVRVFDSWFGSELGAECFPSTAWSNVIAGIDWVAANAIKPAVVNMSLGGDYVQAVNDATATLVASGVTVVVAAGNAGTDACTQSPAATPSAITVAASNIWDQRAYFSNGGSCVDLFAPGEQIISSYWLGDQDVALLSGTSMASPHVAGAAAVYLHAHPSAQPAEVVAALANAATRNVLTNFNVAGTPNLLLYVTQTGGSESPPPPPPPGDNASFDGSCAGFSCQFTAVSAGGWSVTDGASGSGLTFAHTFAPRRKYTVTHTVGTASQSRLVNCNPKRCTVQ